MKKDHAIILNTDPSGDYFDYTLTWQPERPYIHDYAKSYTMKLYMADPDQKGGSKVYNTFEQVNVFNVTADGLEIRQKGLPVVDESIKLSLGPVEMVSVFPHK